MTGDKKSVQLLGLLRQLRSEIDEWQEENRADGKEAHFDIQTIDLETKLLVKTEKGGEGGLNLVFIPVTIGAKANYGNEQVHTLKIKLSPKTGHGDLGDETRKYNRQRGKRDD